MDCIFNRKGIFMLKKLFMIALGLVIALPVRAELKVDIVAGAANPISIAVQKFEVSDGVRSKDASMIREVVEADLKRTGLFRIVNHDAFPECVKMHEMPNFKSWAAIKTQVLVQTKMTAESGDR